MSIVIAQELVPSNARRSIGPFEAVDKVAPIRCCSLWAIFGIALHDEFLIQVAEVCICWSGRPICSEFRAVCVLPSTTLVGVLSIRGRDLVHDRSRVKRSFYCIILVRHGKNLRINLLLIPSQIFQIPGIYVGFVPGDMCHG